MEDRAAGMARRFEIPVLAAALLVIPVIVIEESEPGAPWSTIAAVANWIIWLVFAAELVAMLAVVPSRKAWLRRHLLEVAVVVLTPPFAPASLQAARAFRLARLIRLAAAVKVFRGFFTMAGLRYATLIVVDSDGDGLYDEKGGDGRRVTLRTDLTQDLFDRYDRLLAYVTTSGTMLQTRMLSVGWATTHVYGGKPFQKVRRFRAAERRARENDRGVYDHCGGDFHSKQ